MTRESLYTEVSTHSNYVLLMWKLEETLSCNSVDSLSKGGKEEKTLHEHIVQIH